MSRHVSTLIPSLIRSLQSFTLSGPTESLCPVGFLLSYSVFSSLCWILFWSHVLALDTSTSLRTSKVQKRFMESRTGRQEKAGAAVYLRCSLCVSMLRSRGVTGAGGWPGQMGGEVWAGGGAWRQHLDFISAFE